MSSLPLTRNQIFDVSSLIGRAIRDAGGGGSTSHRPSLGPSTNTSLFASSSGTAGFRQPLSAFPTPILGFATSDEAVSTTKTYGPIRNGLFVDVMSRAVCDSWTDMEKALYLVWWAFRPACCRVCGSSDRWLPSTEDEYQCDHCSTGNGSTRTNEVVEDVPGMGDGDGDSSQDENDGNQAGPGGGASSLGARHGVQALSGVALVSLFCVYITHLERLPIDIRPPSSVYPMILRMATELAELVPLPSDGEAQLSGKGGQEALSSSSVADAEEHPGTLIRTASLFIACCVLCPGLVPFPIFMRQAPARSSLAAVASAAGKITSTLANNRPLDDQSSNASSATTGAFACQWMDVAALASNIGLILDDFFDSEGTVTAFLTNIMVMVKDFSPSSLAWSPQRDPTRMTYIMNMLATRRNGLSTEVRPAAGTALSALRPKQRFSPEHTAAFVAIELVRCYEGSRAAGNCERLKEWYDRNAPIFLPGFTLQGDAASEEEAYNKSDYALLPSSKWGNLLLWIYATKLFGISALELCELLMASGVFGAPTRFFEVLTSRVSKGFYDMPLQRRLRPYVSPWAALFSALHSEDRLVLMSALHLANQRFSGTQQIGLGAAASNISKEEQRVIELVQRILRKHGSLHRYQFNYGLHVDDQLEQHMHGNFFCTHASQYQAVYACLRSGRKTIAFDSNANIVRLNYMDAKQRVVPSIDCEFIGPVVAAIEDLTTKMVFDLVRFQSHEVEWADAQRRIVARETIKRRLQSGTNPKIALNDLRSILAGATVPMTSITISCGLVPTGELGSGANSDAMEGVLKKVFATANSTPNALAPGTSIVVSAASQQQRGSKLSMLDQMSMDSAKSFAAAMSGASQTQSSAQTAAAVTSSATDAHQAASLDLQNRQLATLFRSLERQVYCLPAAELVMGLSVAKQLTAFAEHHALSEGPYIGSHRHLHHHHHHHHHHTNKNGGQPKKHIHNKQGSSRSGGYSSGGSGVEESGSSDTPNYPPPSAEEALLATAIAAVTGAKVMTQADGSGNEPISAASHVSSSTFRLESRFAAEVQLRSAINRYRAYKTSGTVDASVESAEAVRRANRKKQRQQALAEQQQQQTEHAADEPAGQVDQYLFSSPPQKLTAILKNRSNLRDSADLQTHTSTTANSRQQLANSRSPLVTGAKVAISTGAGADDDDGEDQVIEDDEAVTEKTGAADSQYLGRKSRKEAAAAAASRTSKGATEGGAAPSETPTATKRPRDDHDNTESKETPAVSQSQSVEQPSEPNPSKGRRVESAEVEAAPMHSTLVSSEEDAPVTEALSDRKPSSYQGLNAKRREEMAKRRSENLKKERFASEENLF